jgi:NADPH:quinone reductase-like Zn-dependent oxidoreductase
MPKTVALGEYGPLDVLTWKDVPMPEPGPGRIRIRVRAAGVGRIDLQVRPGEVQFFERPPDAVPLVSRRFAS